MSGTLQRIKVGDEYRDAWEGAVRENPACGFMQSAFVGRAPGAPGGGGLIRGCGCARDGRIEGGAIFHAARSLDGPGILGHARRTARPLARPGARPPCSSPRSAAGRAGWLGGRTASSGGSSPVSLVHCRLISRGFVRAPVDFDPFETNEVDLANGMAGVVSRMTSKRPPAANVGLAMARRLGSKIEVTTDPASAARFPSAVRRDRRFVRGFAAEPLCYLMDPAAILFLCTDGRHLLRDVPGRDLGRCHEWSSSAPAPRTLYGAGRREHLRRSDGMPSALQAGIMAEAIGAATAPRTTFTGSTSRATSLTTRTAGSRSSSDDSRRREPRLRRPAHTTCTATTGSRMRCSGSCRICQSRRNPLVGSLRDLAHDLRCRRPDGRLEHFLTARRKV